MTAKEAYDHTAERARRLLRLHDGLINLRRYKIRSDWKESFCRIMHWSSKSRIDRVDSRDAIIVLRDNSLLTRDDFTADALDDLLRCALAFGVSALDRYVHERVIKGIIEALKKTDLNRRQEEFAVPAVLALQTANAVRRAAKEKRDIRPANELRKRIQEILYRQPFQNWKQIEEAFELIGVRGLAGQLQRGYRISDFTPIRQQLSGIIEKRNRIVHEGDLPRHERGGKARKSAILRGYVLESLDFLDRLIGRLEHVT